MSRRLERLMEPGSFFTVLCLAKNTGNILFQNTNKAKHPHFRFICHSVSSQSTLSQLSLKNILFWLSFDFSSFLPWNVSCLFFSSSFAYLHTFTFPGRKRKKFHPSLSSQDSSHTFHLPAWGQSFGKEFLLLYLLSPKMSFYFPCLTDGCTTTQPHWDFHKTPRTTRHIQKE